MRRWSQGRRGISGRGYSPAVVSEVHFTLDPVIGIGRGSSDLNSQNPANKRGM